MKQIKAVQATEENIKEFGRFVDIYKQEKFPGRFWDFWMTPEPIMNQPSHFGVTFAKTYAPYVVNKMERHTKTEETMIAGDKPFVVALANSDPSGKAKTEDIKAFIVQPSQMIVINKGIWHDSCRGIDGPMTYYFLSLETDEKAVFLPLDGEDVEVVL